MDFGALEDKALALLSTLFNQVTSVIFYAQCGLALLAFLLAYGFAQTLRNRISILKQPPVGGDWLQVKLLAYKSGVLIFPLLALIALMVAEQISVVLLDSNWVIRICQGFTLIFIFYSIIKYFVNNFFIKFIFKWLLIPIAILQVFGWLDSVIAYLESIDIQLGNIHLSAYLLVRVLIFGSILFWLGRISNTFGQQVIRKQEAIDVGTREVFAKLFEVLTFIIIFLLLLQIIGVNLTTLAVFGGALGVGLGFGLQAIASNFISGIIILLDRSVKVGDYIELDDNAQGFIRQLSMRSALLETFDGKDIVVPNEQFITSRFTNWTHRSKKQRYPLAFQVAYDTDIPKLLELVRQTVRSHPQVIDGTDIPEAELADAEISVFGESGIDILVEFWMEGIDDGENSVCADLMLMIWQALKDHNIEMPFPQREVRLLNDPPQKG